MSHNAFCFSMYFSRCLTRRTCQHSSWAISRQSSSRACTASSKACTRLSLQASSMSRAGRRCSPKRWERRSSRPPHQPTWHSANLEVKLSYQSLLSRCSTTGPSSQGRQRPLRAFQRGGRRRGPRGAARRRGCTFWRRPSSHGPRRSRQVSATLSATLLASLPNAHTLPDLPAMVTPPISSRVYIYNTPIAFHPPPPPPSHQKAKATTARDKYHSPIVCPPPNFP